MKSCQLITLPVGPEQIAVIEVDSRYYVPIRPIAKLLGLNWQGQKRKVLSFSRHYHASCFPVQDASGRVIDQPCVLAERFGVYICSLSRRVREGAAAALLERLDADWDGALNMLMEPVRRREAGRYHISKRFPAAGSAHANEEACREVGPPTEWLLAMARACDATSQRHVAKRLGIRPQAVNHLVHNHYPGEGKNIAERILAVLMA